MGGDGAKCKIFRQFVYLVSAVSLLPLTIYVVSTNRLRNVDDQETKVIEDNVHGQMRVPSYFLEFINTLEFQRLRNVKQLGLTYSVFSGAMHTRFEHCIGTGYLSYTLLQTLERNSGIKIDAMFKKCVAIAGLLHDLGHGPLSHLWTDLVRTGVDQKWTHEQSSCEMAAKLIETNNITLWNTNEEQQYCLELIQALIVGDIIKLKQLLSTEINFLSEIVNNKFCNIDVDKVDYLLRDGYHLKHSIEIDKEFAKFLDGAKIVKDSKNVTHIGFNIKDYPLVCQMFENRASIHINIVQDPRIIAAEQMIVDAFLEAENSGYTFKNEKLSEVHRNLNLFTQFDDTIVKFIEMNEDPKLIKAQEIFKRIKLGRFYEVIWESSHSFDVDTLNKQLGNHFFLKHKRVPQPEVSASIILFDERGLVKPKTNNKSLSFESYIVFSKTEDHEINRKAKAFMTASKIKYNN